MVQLVKVWNGKKFGKLFPKNWFLLGCNCKSGSNGNSCTEDGQCNCKQIFTGLQCDEGQ